MIEFKTGVGVDQGCPGSPVAFAFGMRRALRRIRARIQTWLDQTASPAASGTYLAILSYLDDLSVILPPVTAEHAIPIMNFEKSLCWVSSAKRPPGHGVSQLWNNASRHDGMVLCGCPFQGMLSIDDASDMDIDTALPVGSPEFIETFLAKYGCKIGDLVQAIADIPAKCSPGRLAVQSANLMLRHCCSQKATHLTRLLPPRRTRELATFIDTVVADGFCRLNGLSGLEHWQRMAIAMPLSRGGCGTRRFSCTFEAAYV